MAIKIKAVRKTNPNDATLPMRYYPRVVKSGEIDLEMLSEQICQSTTVTEADCQAVIFALVAKVSLALEQGQIVRLGPLGAFQVSVKGTASEFPIEVTPKTIKSVSLIYRPSPRFKKMLAHLKFVKER
ncbi:MAG: hypothetical protein RL427_23 [Bacteroidota bacterium]|jgi:predicted histone-like DNA-binding protein